MIWYAIPFGWLLADVTGYGEHIEYMRDGLSVGDACAKVGQSVLHTQENGGVTMCLTPECETIHDSNGCMTQRIPSGASIVIDKETERATLLSSSGAAIEVVEHCSIRDLTRLQMRAAG